MSITKNSLLIAILGACMCACMLSGCEMNPSEESSGSGEPLKTMSAPEVSVTALRDGFDLSWKPVEGASSYTVYWTWNDYPVSPSASDSAHIYSATVSTASFSHRYLLPENRTGYQDSALSKYSAYAFKYLVVASASGYANAVSAISENNMVHPVVTVRLTFEEYGNQDIGVVFLDVPYDPVSQSVLGHADELAVYAGKTDSSGNALIEVEVGRDRYYGCALFKDLDGSGSLTYGDIVLGTGSASMYSYSYWAILTGESITRSLAWGVGESSHVFAAE